MSDDTIRVPGYLDPKPPAPATTPTDLRLPVVAGGGDNPDSGPDRNGPHNRDADTTPQLNRPSAAVELTQPVPAIGENRLRTAGNLLRHRGRCCRVLVDRRGCLCVVGALAVAAGIADASLAAFENNEVDEATEAVYEPVSRLPETAHLVDVIRRRHPEYASRTAAPVHTVWYWADRMDDQAVLAVLDEAADSYQQVSA